MANLCSAVYYVAEMALEHAKEATLAAMQKMPVITIRLPKKLIQELDKLTQEMKKLPTTDESTFTRQDCIRIVLRRGIEAIRADMKSK